MNYEIATGASIQALEEKVKNWIKLGWKPVGGIAVNPKSIENKYLQAMIKE